MNSAIDIMCVCVAVVILLKKFEIAKFIGAIYRHTRICFDFETTESHFHACIHFW